MRYEDFVADPGGVVVKLAGAFGLSAAIAGIWFAIIGFAGLYRDGRRDLWAAISGFTPLAALFLAYAKLSTLLPQTLWSGIAMAIAVFAIAATSQAARSRTEPFRYAGSTLPSCVARCGLRSTAAALAR